MRHINKIVLVDDHKLTLDGLRIFLRPHAGRILDACSIEDAIPIIREEKPDLAIVDFRLGATTADELIRDIHYHSPDTRVLVHSFTTAETAVLRSVQAGAHGFIQKGDNPDEILEAAEALISGKMYFNETARFYITRQLGTPENHHFVETVGGISFNDKEIKIIKLLIEELSAKEIAKKIFLSESSVEQYKIKIARKMGAKNMVGIMRFAFKHGIINQEDL